MQLSSRYWEASGLLCLVGQGVLFTGERERKREMGGCMSFRRDGAENMKEVKIGKWKVESENENGNELFFFLSCFVKCVFTKYGPKLGDTGGGTGKVR